MHIPKIMGKFLIYLLLFAAWGASGQSDTIIFLGVNGRLVPEEKAERMKVLDVSSGSRFIVQTFEKARDKWSLQYQEKVKKEAEDRYLIAVKGSGLKGTITRQYERTDDGFYRFHEWIDNRLVKTGHSKTLFPLILHGEVTEYFDNGKCKSKSVFKDNELVSNENWLESGERYMENIFYSADSEPLYSRGMTDMHSHVREALRNSGLDLTKLEGSILIGFVIMEDGSLKGIRVLKGLNSTLDNISVLALQSLPGNWTPARIDGKPVRYFQLFPINFIHWETRFESVEFNGSTLHWDLF